jgi:hypothetical protein
MEKNIRKKVYIQKMRKLKFFLKVNCKEIVKFIIVIIKRELK